MELSKFTNKCQLAEEALREVLKEVDKDNEDVYWTLNDAVNMLSNLAISEGPFIGRSMMKCLLIEKEDEANSVQGDKESLNYTLRKVRLLFDTMGELGITRMNKNVFDGVLFVFYEEEEINKELAESDEAQIDDFKEQIEEIMKARPDYFEMGKLESCIECNESCRGTEKVISKEQWGEGVSCTTTTRPDKCLYKDWL